MFARLFAAVCGEVRTARPAHLGGYARYRVRGEPYPGLVPQPGSHTRGVLYENLTGADWRRLDAFEGLFYKRRHVVVVLSGGARVGAWTYLIAEEHRRILDTTRWSASAFARRHLATYLTDLD